LQPFLSIGGNVDGEVVCLQTFDEGSCYFRLIFNDKNTHKKILPEAAPLLQRPLRTFDQLKIRGSARKEAERKGCTVPESRFHDWQVLIAKKAASVTLITSQRDVKKRALTRSNLCKNLQNSSEHRGRGQAPKRFAPD
jgi:hypothetical protein